MEWQLFRTFGRINCASPTGLRSHRTRQKSQFWFVRAIPPPPTKSQASLDLAWFLFFENSMGDCTWFSTFEPMNKRHIQGASWLEVNQVVSNTKEGSPILYAPTPWPNSMKESVLMKQLASRACQEFLVAPFTRCKTRRLSFRIGTEQSRAIKTQNQVPHQLKPASCKLI